MLLPKLVHSMIMYYRIKTGTTVHQEIQKWCYTRKGAYYDNAFGFVYDQEYQQKMHEFKGYLAEKVEKDMIYFRNTSIECNYQIESHAGCMTSNHFYFKQNGIFYGLQFGYRWY